MFLTSHSFLLHVVLHEEMCTTCLPTLSLWLSLKTNLICIRIIHIWVGKTALYNHACWFKSSMHIIWVYHKCSHRQKHEIITRKRKSCGPTQLDAPWPRIITDTGIKSNAHSIPIQILSHSCLTNLSMKFLCLFCFLYFVFLF